MNIASITKGRRVKSLIRNRLGDFSSASNIMSREVQFCFAIPRAEGFPPVKRSSQIHSFAIQDILGLSEKSSKPKAASHQSVSLVKCFSPVSARLEAQNADHEKASALPGECLPQFLLCYPKIRFRLTAF